MSVDAIYFDASNQLFALPAHTVREVLRAVKISPLPQAPRCVEGVINLRGTVTPVLNFRRLLGLTPLPTLPRHFLIVLAGERPLALLAENLRGLLPLDAGQIAAPPEELATKGYLEGVANTAQGLALALNAGGLSRAVWSAESITVNVTGGADD